MYRIPFFDTKGMSMYRRLTALTFGFALLITGAAACSGSGQHAGTVKSVTRAAGSADCTVLLGFDNGSTRSVQIDQKPGIKRADDICNLAAQPGTTFVITASPQGERDDIGFSHPDVLVVKHSRHLRTFPAYCRLTTKSSITGNEDQFQPGTVSCADYPDGRVLTQKVVGNHAVADVTLTTSVPRAGAN